MPLPDIWSDACVTELHRRIDSLTPSTQPKWGTMNVAQMLGHCCMPYAQALGDDTQKSAWYIRLVLQLFFKKSMTNEVPYKPSMPTNPAFIMPADSEFEPNRDRLKAYIRRFADQGRASFEGRNQLSLGKLSATEWNNLMYKHLDHHLRQFGE
ncbi:MAG: DUF1569 domain-containing protein [Candidatus Kapabacteria bacterium]|nr:DUF1569 domain-containing protein [Candidatus Kapabacteria bacterium]